jgi:hypothetical protein
LPTSWVVQGASTGGDVLTVDDVTVKSTPLLAMPPAVTTTLPDVAPPGTTATMLVPFQLAVLAVVPLNRTIPGVVPKFEPVIVTDVPELPAAGDRLLMDGIGTSPISAKTSADMGLVTPLVFLA